MSDAFQLVMCCVAGCVTVTLVGINVELGRIRASLLRSENKR